MKCEQIGELPKVENGTVIMFHGISNYDGQPTIHVVMSTTAVSLDDILPQFGDFLRGMGFAINGELEIVNEED